MPQSYDLIVIGAGPAGFTAAISAAGSGRSVLILEKMPQPGLKLKATGGGKCNFTNTLETHEFMERFGREGRFMTPALQAMDSRGLISFLKGIGVESHAPDGFRLFPKTHNAVSVAEALKDEAVRMGVELKTSTPVESLSVQKSRIRGVNCGKNSYLAKNVILAAGGRGYPHLGARGDGFTMAREWGHAISYPYPAMLPLYCKENWVKKCTADTIAKAEIRIHLPKYKKLKARGDLIFTQSGIRGPLVLDIAREITPLLEKEGAVPLLINLTKGLNKNQIVSLINQERQKNPQQSILSILQILLPPSVARALCDLAGAQSSLSYKKLSGQTREKLIQLLAWTPLTVTGHPGWNQAMITRGGIKLKEINPDTLESRLISGLYFCGEVVDLDGPCGGYNLQWAFSSGYLAGKLGNMG